jgi:tRNA A-37 threonylcarbamoyl transferase component Bud32
MSILPTHGSPGRLGARRADPAYAGAPPTFVPATQNPDLGYRRAVTEPREAPPTPDPQEAGSSGSEPVPSPPQPPDVGRLIDDRYRLGDVIGVGGMATIHRAFDTRLERSVAVKLLRPEILEDADLAMRFRREALAATVLRHPNIVACLETGSDHGRPFIVMELIEGEDLATRLRRGGRLAPTEAARIALDIARALGVAHVRGIVHRDIKPGNILLARDGRAMVTDFGIARLAADAEGTVPGMTLGSVHYFSPEQAQGATTTAASDVYSLGLVLFEMLTGKRAWHGDTTAELAAARIDAPPPSPKAIRPEVPAALDAVVVRALDPEPLRRYANGSAIATALEEAIGYPDPSSPTIAVPAAAAAATAGTGTAVVTAPPGGLGVARPGALPDGIVPPLQPGSAGGPPAGGRGGRRASPVIAGPLVVLTAVAAVVGGGLLLAALPGSDSGTAAILSPSPKASRTPVPTATPRPTPRPTPTPAPTAKPTPAPVLAQPTPRQAGTLGDLCQPILGFPCGLGAGTYQPATFEPAVSFRLGDGWSTSLYEPDIVSLERDDGALTLAGSVAAAGGQQDPPPSARDLVEVFIETDGVAAARPDTARVDKRRATTVDLSPTGVSRVALFSTAKETFYLEPHGTTRLIVVDTRDGIMVLAIEPADGRMLQDILPAANQVIGSLRFR